MKTNRRPMSSNFLVFFKHSLYWYYFEASCNYETWKSPFHLDWFKNVLLYCQGGNQSAMAMALSAMTLVLLVVMELCSTSMEQRMETLPLSQMISCRSLLISLALDHKEGLWFHMGASLGCHVWYLHSCHCSKQSFSLAWQCWCSQCKMGRQGG